ncbi:MAG: cyclic nucleotide-binding domain-containing protein [Acidaminococcaceae bacterium]|nr:cyclic nucleotide-binding domain-containing protein [Acidaminococcaceae bacterium]
MDKYLQIIASSSLFHGIAKTELAAVLKHLDVQMKVYPRNGFIWRLGERVTTAGFVVAGSVHILREDYWGRQNILAQLGCGHLFGEVYACLQQVPLTISMAAPNGAAVIFLDLKRLLSGPSRSEAESRLLHNLLLLMAERNFFLTQKMEYLTKRTTRENAGLSFGAGTPAAEQ